MSKIILSLWLAACLLAACDSAGNSSAEQQNGGGSVAVQEKVATSGKKAVPLADVPVPVVDAARAAQPQLKLAEASSEIRDGRNYFDLEGTLPDGTELELDMMEEGGVWRVVETQRDISFDAVPPAVRVALESAESTFVPGRIIESRQADDLIIYEFFEGRPPAPEGRKLEVKFAGGKAELLTSEWLH